MPVCSIPCICWSLIEQLWSSAGLRNLKNKSSNFLSLQSIICLYFLTDFLANMLLWALLASQSDLETEGKRVRGASAQPNSLCKQRQINSPGGMLGVNSETAFFSQPFSLLPITPSVFHAPLSVSLTVISLFEPPWQWLISEKVKMLNRCTSWPFPFLHNWCLFVLLGLISMLWNFLRLRKIHRC